METITSRDNRKLKFARSVREGKDKEHIFIEGVRLVNEALRSGLDPVDILISDSFKLNVIDSMKLIECIKNTAVMVANKIFIPIADTGSPQGIILIAKRPSSGLADIEQGLKSSKIPVVVCLHQINNPSNLGAIFRSAEAAGVAGIILSKGAADAFSPKAQRAAMGANLRLPIVENVEFSDLVNWARENGLKPTAADIGGKTNYIDSDWKKARLLVFGSEAHGLSGDELVKMEEIVNIPMESDVESLNIAVSAGIILFEAKRQIAL